MEDLTILENKTHKAINKLRIILQHEFDERGYSVVVYTHYVFISGSKNNSSDLNISFYDLQNEGTFQEIITEVLMSVTFVELLDMDQFIYKVILLIHDQRSRDKQVL